MEKYIRENFTSDEIRFFGESACFNDVDLINDSLPILKWKSDIYIKVSGNLNSTDSLGVENVIAELNRLDLPIKARWEKDNSYSNFEFCFLNKEQSDSLFREKAIYFPGTSMNYYYFGMPDTDVNGITTNATVYILEYSPAVDPEFQSHVILHEFINALGLGGDTYFKIESILYDIPMDTKRTCLSDIDKAALRLLYSPVIPFGLKRGDFIRLFPDIFTDNGLTEKDYRDFENYIKENKIPESVINTFIKYGFNINSRDDRSYVMKWKTKPLIRYQEDNDKYAILKPAVDSLNTYLPDELKIGYAEKDKNYNICFRPGKSLLNCNIARTGLQLVAVNIDDKYYNTDNNDSRLMFRLLLETSGIYPIFDHPFFHLNELTCPEFLRFFFSLVVKSGMEKERLVEIIKKQYSRNREIEQSYKELDNYFSQKPLSDSVMLRIWEIMEDRLTGELIHKWDSVRPAHTGYHEFDHANVLKMIKQLLPHLNFNFTTIDSCNLLVIPKDDMRYVCAFGNIPGVNQSVYSGFAFAKISEDKAYQNLLIFCSIMGSLFNSMLIDGAIKEIDKEYDITLFPYRQEALEFYYSPNIVSGMEKDRVLQIICKHYPQLFSDV